jgi:hypothetical protein
MGGGNDGDISFEIVRPNFVRGAIFTFRQDHLPILSEQGFVHSSYRRTCVRSLRRLSRLSSRLPPSFFVHHAVKEGQHPFTCGGFAVSSSVLQFMFLKNTNKLIDLTISRISGRAAVTDLQSVLRFCLPYKFHSRRAANLHRGKYSHWSNSATMEIMVNFQMFYREALYWRSLCHPNILPFLGVSTKVLPPLSLISPWMENGCLMRYPEQNPDYDRLKAVCVIQQCSFL